MGKPIENGRFGCCGMVSWYLVWFGDVWYSSQSTYINEEKKTSMYPSKLFPNNNYLQSVGDNYSDST
jgi:hypothetical protein